MKKLYLVLMIAGLFVGSQVLADVVTTTRKINKPQAQQPQTMRQQGQATKSTKPTVTTRPSTGNKLVDNIRSCKPYSETMVSDIDGVNFDFKVTIGGWVNNKCRLDFMSDVSGIASSFKQIYGVDASQAQISAFAPKVRCEFTKQQLEYVGDSILQEQARNKGGNGRMLKNPNEIDISFNDFTASDARLMKVLMNDRACSILNADDLGNMLQNLMGF